jgi:hypothetical protein
LAANTSATNALSAGSYANSAYALANTKYSSSGGSISGDVTITGNLIITGTTTTVSANNLSIQDNMIYLNANNTTINPDLGIAGNYNDGTYHHAGMFRDATDGTWKFFYNYQPEPDASPYIDTAHATFRIANLTANLITDVATIRGFDPINHTNSAYALANTSDQKAVSAGSYANSAYSAANTADQRAVTSGVYANAAFGVANTSTTASTQADQRAVTSGDYANSSYIQANTATTNAATADQRAVTSGSYANSAYTAANTADQKAVSAGSYANSAYTAANASVSLTGTQTLTNKTLTAPIITSPVEKYDAFYAEAPGSTLNQYLSTSTIDYYTGNATTNFTWNVAWSAGTSLGSYMSAGQSLSLVLLITNGSTAYYPTSFTIDGASVTPKYPNGATITSGTANGIDLYNMTIIKTNVGWTVLLSQTKMS